MNLAVILPALTNKGPIIVAKDICQQLVQAGHTVDVYYFDHKEEINISASNIFKIKPSQKIPFYKYDIIHSHGIRPDYYVYRHARHLKSRCVTTMHNYMIEDLKHQYNFLIASIFSRIWMRIISRHDVVVTLSEHMKAYYQKRRKELNLHVIYNGRSFTAVSNGKQERIPPEDIRLMEHFRSKFIVMGVVVQLTKRKGVDQLIKALKELPGFGLLIVGDGKEKKNLQRLAAKTGVADQCLFMGYRTNGSDFLAYMDIYMMVSRSEGFPLSLIEAASHALPLVCSDIPVFKEVFVNGEVVFFELESIPSLVSAITDIAQKRNEQGQKIQQFYASQLTSAAMANKYLVLYKKLLNKEI